MTKTPLPKLPKLPKPERRALAAAWSGSVPSSASAIHARWWQLEAWLRSLVYVELRSRYGAAWTAQLPARTDGMRDRDNRQLRYMSTPDAADFLSYLDVGELFELIDKHWDLFAPSLLDQRIWATRSIELNKIRRRIAHCRRPHSDDLARLEQTLRDLDEGAFRAMACFNDVESADRSLPDPLVRRWGQDQYPPGHIANHAAAQYDTRFSLRYSVRPWANRPADDEPISGSPGILWHARWHGAYIADLAEWWRDSYLDIDGWRDLIVYVCADMTGIQISFAACDDPLAIARGIEHCFQATLQRRWPDEDFDAYQRRENRWLRKAADLDLRIQVHTGWSTLTPELWPIEVFDA